MSGFFEQNSEPNYGSPRINSYNITESDMSSFLSKTYGWMAFAMLLSGLAAWFLGHNTDFMSIFLAHPFMLLIAEFALVFALSFFIDKISYQVASLIFVVYSLLNGVTLSFYFLIYTAGSIVSTFAVCALTFGVMALYGYYTKRDLSTIGKYLMFGLIGLIIATVVNAFIGNSMVDLVCSYVGVVVFIGLTAYDTQKIKALAMQADGSEAYSKLALLGALNIYLDFINLFIYMLRIMGDRRD